MEFFAWLARNFFMDAAPSNATTPDELIANAILRQFAKDVASGGLTVTGSIAPWTTDNKNLIVLGNVKSRPYRIVFKRGYSIDPNGNWLYCLSGISVTVVSEDRLSEIKLDDGPATKLGQEVLEFLRAKKKAEEVAAAAQLTMEENEKKWAVAEELLGMRRNAQGALVPRRCADCGEELCEGACQHPEIAYCFYGGDYCGDTACKKECRWLMVNK